jgi:phosphate transport system permease protein
MTAGPDERAPDFASRGWPPDSEQSAWGRFRAQDGMGRLIFLGASSLSVLALALMVLFLFREGLGLFKTYALGSFLFGQAWYPTYDPPDFGIATFIAGSLAVTLLSSAIAVPLGLGCALYLAEVAGPRVRELVKPAVELLASLPSVVLGFLGMVVLAPLMQQWLDIPTGLNVLNASLMLAIMALPAITSISEDALYAVPLEQSEASLALGATRWETLSRVVMPGAASGIGSAVILGMSRAIGETMVVLMVAGGAAQIPGSIFDSVRPLPAVIAAEMGETPFGSEHYHALFALGTVLFMLTLLFNLLAEAMTRRYRPKGAP